MVIIIIYYIQITRGNGRGSKLQFIPPGSMKNFASSIKQRDRNIQNLLSRRMQNDQEGQFIRENVAKKRHGL